MRTSKPNYNSVWIGRVGETGATDVIFPLIEGWESANGYGLVVVRPGETTPYPCDVNVAEDGVHWTPNSGDLLYAGKGKAELILTGASGEIVKSVIYQTAIGKALTDDMTDPPAPWEGYVESVLAAGAKAENMTATASVDDTSGTPAVSVTKTETADSYNLDFAFTGLKGTEVAASRNYYGSYLLRGLTIDDKRYFVGNVATNDTPVPYCSEIVGSLNEVRLSTMPQGFTVLSDNGSIMYIPRATLGNLDTHLSLSQLQLLQLLSQGSISFNCPTTADVTSYFATTESCLVFNAGTEVVRMGCVSNNTEHKTVMFGGSFVTADNPLLENKLVHVYVTIVSDGNKWTVEVSSTIYNLTVQ